MAELCLAGPHAPCVPGSNGCCDAGSAAAGTGLVLQGSLPLLGEKKIILLASWLHSAIAVLCVSMSCWLGCSPGAQTFPAAAAALGGQETLSSSL